MTPAGDDLRLRHAGDGRLAATPRSVELGVKFKADYDGTITGIRFYKAAANTGTHIGSLWTAAGTRLAQATFTNETRLRLADGDVRQPGRGHRRARPTSPPTSRPAATTRPRRRPRPRPSTTRRCTRSPTARAPTASTPTAPTSAFPTQHLQRRQLLGRRHVRACRRPGRSTGVDRDRGRQRRRRTSSWTAPATGGPVSSYRITPYVGATAQTPTTVTGTPPATSTTVTGLTTGTTYTFTRPGGQRQRRRAGLGAVQRGDARSAAVAPVGADRRDARSRRPTSARVSWTRPTSDGDSAITGYTVTPYIGARRADAGARSARRRRARRSPGLTNGTAYTFKVTATNGVGTGAAVGGVERGHAAGDDLRLRRRRRPSTRGDSDAVELGVKFTRRLRRLGHRHPLLQGRGQHRHPRRQPVDRRRHAARARRRSPTRRPRGWQTRDVRHPGRRSRRARPTSRPTSRPTATTR